MKKTLLLLVAWSHCLTVSAQDSAQLAADLQTTDAAHWPAIEALLKAQRSELTAAHLATLAAAAAESKALAQDLATQLATAKQQTEQATAAKAAAAHEMILRLPDGYDTRITAIGGRLSGGQMQRIGLARAFYGDPVLLILDEPNSNLDNEGSLALNAAIRALKARGGSALIMAHRPAAIQECDTLLVLEDGTRRAFGPRDQVLRDMVKNHAEITSAAAQGGVR